MQNESTFILLFVVATTVAIASRRLQIPYTVALVLAASAGLASVVPARRATRLDPAHALREG